MTNEEDVQILKQGVEVWNNWRKENPEIIPDLEMVDLRGKDLTGVNLSKANMYGSFLKEITLRGANLSEASMLHSVITFSDLSNAKMVEALLGSANLYEADLTGADLTNAVLDGAGLVRTIVENTIFTGCVIYGISAWDLRGVPEDQSNLIISHEHLLTVDNLEVAQFIYLLLNNEKIRNVIDTIGQKGVLILGRFTKDRKAILDAIREKLRELNFVPMMFDFEKPTQRDFTETIKTLTGLSRFIIADITNPKSSPLELQATMPDYMIPFVPIIQEDEEPFAMFQDLQQKYKDWVLDVLKYDSADNLLKVLDKAVVKPALKKADELLIKKAEGIRDRHVKDYM